MYAATLTDVTVLVGAPPPSDLPEVVGQSAGQFPILESVSLTIPLPGITVLLGPNGCGKSSLVRLLTGFVYPSSGSVTVLGEVLGQAHIPTLRQRVQLIQALAPLAPDDDMTTLDVVLTGPAGTIDLHHSPPPSHVAQARQLLAQMGVEEIGPRLFRQLSAGQRMRALIARALLAQQADDSGRPSLLLLDEPTASLDLVARSQFLALLSSFAKLYPQTAVLLITHHVEEIPPCARQVIVMSSGRVAANGLPAETITSDILSAAFNAPICLTTRMTQHGMSYSAALTPTQPAPADGVKLNR